MSNKAPESDSPGVMKPLLRRAAGALPGLAAALLLALPSAVAAQTTQPVGDGSVPPAVEPLPKATFTPGQIQQLLDRTVPPMALHEAQLTELLRRLEGKRGRWLDLPRSTLSLLPYGEQTPVSLRVPSGTSLGKLLKSLLDPLSLEYRMIEDGRGRAVLRVVPRPALIRVGRRANIDELELLYTIRRLRIRSVRTPLLTQVRQAAGRPVEMQFDLFGTDGPTAYEKFNKALEGLPPNTVAGLLDQFCVKGSWTWRVDSNIIWVLDRSKQVVHQLGRHVAVQWSNTPLDEALAQLGRAAGVLVQFEPGMTAGVDQDSRRITWRTADQSVLQIIETVNARTGLAYEVRMDSIYFFGSRGARYKMDPVVGMVSIPSATGKFNYQFFLRKSMLPKDAQETLDRQMQQAVDSMAKELATPDAGKKP